MRKIAYIWVCKLVDKVNGIDIVEPRKNAKFNWDFQYKSLDKIMTLNLIEVMIYQIELHWVTW